MGNWNAIVVKLRLFIAITLPDPLLCTLQSIQQDLREELRGIPIRWVRTEGIHLTLKFLGDVEESRVDDIRQCIVEIASVWHSMRLALRAIGVFPSIERPRILWCGLDGELERVSQLQEVLEVRLETIGFPREPRLFKPHLTLGRFRRYTGISVQSVETIKFTMNEFSDLCGNRFVAGSIRLIKSELDPLGSIYTTLVTTTLQS